MESRIYTNDPTMHGSPMRISNLKERVKAVPMKEESIWVLGKNDNGCSDVAFA